MQYTLETKDGIKLAELRQNINIDTEMFCFGFDFDPTPEFENHRELFDKASQSDDIEMDESWEIIEIINKRFQLIPIGNASPITDFIPYIDGKIAIIRAIFDDTPLTSTRLDEKPTWQLHHGKIVIGTLTQTEKDSPYIYCQFTPTSAFENVSSLFADELKALKNNDDSWSSYVTKIQNLRLRFAPMNSITPVVKADVLHIEGSKAWFRVIAEKER